MLFGICLLIALYFIYLMKGTILKLVLGIFGWLGMYEFLIKHGLNSIALTILDYSFTWAQVIPTVIIILLMMNIKDE